MVEKGKQYQTIDFLISLALAASFFFLLARSFELMVIKGGWFRSLAQENRLRRLRLPSQRGEIVDRQGRKLAENKVFYCVADKGASPFGQENNGDGCLMVSRDKALKLEAKGKLVQKRFGRFYPLSVEAAHLTGYLGEINKGENLACPGFKPEDYAPLVGRSGLEKYYDCVLRGKNGWRLVEVDAVGRILRDLGSRSPRPGRNIALTIDGWLQKKVAQAMKGKKGAVVALDPANGQMLALYSSPSFDPNKFTFERNDKLISGWLADREGRPLFNRAVSGAYYPGSVFKPITAIAALESGKVDGRTLVEDTGVIKIGRWQYSNWYWSQYGRKEGMVDMVKAIKRSNDIYFYKIGETAGAEAIVNWAEKFGLGKKTEIDLPAEAAGLVPSPKWKMATKGEKWFVGNTYHLAIGQGDLMATPLQVAVLTAAFANGGRICSPYLRFDNSFSRPKCYSLGVKKENIDLVAKGMVAACRPKGTGFPFFDFTPQVGCKTGTAEIGDGTGDSHAWFTVFAPAVQPKIVLTVFLERGGSGAWEAAPIAKEILADYFKINQ